MIPLLAASIMAAQPSSAQVSIGITNVQGAGGFRERVGETLTFICPATDGAKATIYGTDTYTDDSMICPAAIHAGILKPGRAGVVSILMGKGAREFRGSERNGVASRSYGAWGYSYSFVREGAPGTITWRTNWDPWDQIPADFTEPVTVTCPEGGENSSPLWGTDVYQKESGICVAAVHAGLISAKGGGLVAVRAVPGPRDKFAASERFGVTSRHWSAQPVAFALAKATTTSGGSTAPPPPPLDIPIATLADAVKGNGYNATINASGGTGAGYAWSISAGVLPSGLTLAATGNTTTLSGAPTVDGSFNFTVRLTDSGGATATRAFTLAVAAPPPPAIDPRTIQLAGITGTGSATSTGAAAPRTLQLAGFSGAGSASGSTQSIAQRTVPIAGWSGAGSAAP